MSGSKNICPDRRSVVAALAALPFLGAGAFAQAAYPDKPIRLVVPYGAGTGTDATARRLANDLQGTLGQPVIVENRAGGAAFIGTQAVTTSAPDGYTLLMATDHIMCFNPALFSKLPYDPVKELTAVAGVVKAPYLLAINGDLPVKTVAELVELAKTRTLTFASTGLGTSSHLIGELFSAETGIKMTHVAYQGGAQLFSDLLAGTISMSFYPYQPFQPHIASGRLRLLAIGTEQRWPVLPDVPTFNELKLPKLTMAAFLSVYAPAGVPKDRIEKLSAAIKTALAKPSIAEPLTAVGFPPAYMTPPELTAYTAKEAKVCKDLVTLANVKLD